MRIVNDPIDRMVGIRVEVDVENAVRMHVCSATRKSVSFFLRAGEIMKGFPYDISDSPLKALPFYRSSWGVQRL